MTDCSGSKRTRNSPLSPKYIFEPNKAFVEDNNNNCYPLLASTVETSFIYSPSKAKKAEKAAYSGMVDVRSHFALIWRGIHQIKP